MKQTIKLGAEKQLQINVQERVCPRNFFKKCFYENYKKKLSLSLSLSLSKTMKNDNWPEESDMKTFLKAQLLENCSFDESIKFKQWVSTKQSQFEDIKEFFEDY